MLEGVNERTSVRDLVRGYPRTRPVLDRFGIDYCCGGRHTIKEAAAQKGVMLDTLFIALKDAFEDTTLDDKDEKDWRSAQAGELADYIEKHYHTFLREQLPRLGIFMAKVFKAHGSRHGDVLIPLQDTFTSFGKEIELHLMKEEQILFPAIRQMEADWQYGGEETPYHCGSIRNAINPLEHEHENAGAALNRMREVTSGYTLPDDACSSFAALYDGLHELEDNLHEHIHLENNILFPEAIELEAKTGYIPRD